MPPFDWARKRVLVTGGNGFVGRFVVRKLQERGVPEVNILAPHQNETDLRDRKNCRRVTDGVQMVIHLAGTTGGIEFHRQNPGSIFYDNLIMGVELMEAARLAGAEKFVGIGSATEYPMDAPIPFREEALWDGYPEPIHAPYSFAKKMLLVQGQACHEQYGFSAIHLMPTNMYGPGKGPQSGYVIPSLIERVRKAKSEDTPFIEVWGTGRAAREFLYVEDAAEAILLAAERYDDPAPVNLGSGQEILIRDLVELIVELVGYKGEIRWDAAKPDGQLRRAVDVSRAEAFGFRAKTSMRDGLRQTIAWHLQTGYK